MKQYTKGGDYHDGKNYFATFGITEVGRKTHAQQLSYLAMPSGKEVCTNPENPEETIDEPSAEWVESDDLGPTDDQFSRFEKELEDAINRTCMENGSNTPDFILAKYLVNCLKAFNKASKDREKWYGKELKI